MKKKIKLTLILFLNEKTKYIMREGTRDKVLLKRLNNFLSCFEAKGRI